jgi:hypothetical protein
MKTGGLKTPFHLSTARYIDELFQYGIIKTSLNFNLPMSQKNIAKFRNQKTNYCPRVAGVAFSDVAS